jgi:hypothetical protein
LGSRIEGVVQIAIRNGGSTPQIPQVITTTRNGLRKIHLFSAILPQPTNPLKDNLLKILKNDRRLGYLHLRNRKHKDIQPKHLLHKIRYQYLYPGMAKFYVNEEKQMINYSDFNPEGKVVSEKILNLSNVERILGVY